MSASAHTTLTLHLRAKGLPVPHHEYRFHPVRRFRFDLCWPDRMLAVEVDGATWTGGRHTRGKGFASDCAKTNLAVECGWRVLRFTTDMVTSGEAVKVIERVLNDRRAA